MQNMMKRLLMIGLLCALLLPTMTFVGAQEEGSPEVTPAVVTDAPAEAEAVQAPGLASLVFLMGLGAVSIVGVVMLARHNFRDESGESTAA